jgi:glycosyltransferase involved in cell wall biosynthesis
MRFLFLITHYHPHVYGAEIFAQKLAEYLVKKGHQVDLVTGRWQNSWKKSQTINGVNVYRVNVIKIRFLQTMLFIFPQLKKAQELVNQHNYDFIHAHIFPSLITGALLKSTAKKIVTLQGGDLADYDEIYGPFKFLLKPLIAKSLKKYHKIHAVSSDLKRKLKHLTHQNSLVIPNAVDEQIFLTKPAIKTVSHYLAYSPSRLTEKNNLVNLIKAIDILRRQGIKLTLKIAGTGHLKSKLEKLIKKLKLQRQVFLLGYLSQSDNHSLIKSADVVVRVSTKEGFGIALLEALALKTSVVASTSGGLKDFISSSNAYIPAGFSAPAIAGAIKNSLIKKTLTQKKIASGFSLVKQKYTYAKVLKEFCHKVYEL